MGGGFGGYWWDDECDGGRGALEIREREKFLISRVRVMRNAVGWRVREGGFYSHIDSS